MLDVIGILLDFFVVFDGMSSIGSSLHLLSSFDDDHNPLTWVDFFSARVCVYAYFFLFFAI